MNGKRQLGAAAVAVAMLAGASAFAEERPSNGTRREGGRIERRERATAPQARVEVRGERSTRSRESERSTTRSGDATRSERSINRSREGERSTTRSRDNDARTERSTTRSADGQSVRRERATTRSRDTESQRSVTNESRSRGRNDRGSYDRGRDSRGSSRGSYDRNRGGRSGGHDRYNRSRPYYHSGRVSRYERWGGGYRVWVGGAGYPFYVPLAHWSPGRFRIGLSIRLGGYYNPLGYYEYYDGYSDGYRAGSYNSSRVYNTVELSGIVEDYDYRRRTALIRDDATDALVTVYMRSRDARLNHLRAGDYIELEGGWKGGLFEAYRVFDVD